MSRILSWLFVGLAFLLGALGAPSSPAAEGLPLKLQDPRTGRGIVVQAGDRALHVVFFATWCPPCLAELERLTELEARWGRQGYRLVLVAVRARQSPERLASFIEQEHPPGQVLFDADGQAEQALQGGEVPTHVVLDVRGEMVVRSGSLDAQVEGALRELLEVKGRPPRTRP